MPETTELYEDEKYYERARLLISKMERPSVCTLQRAFNMGYGRAARIVDALKERGHWPAPRTARGE